MSSAPVVLDHLPSRSIATVYGSFGEVSKRRLDLTYDYEHAQICALRRIAELLEPERFLDIGANIGVYSVYLASVSSLDIVQAFEPAKDSFEVLTANFAMQTASNLEAVPIALSDVDGSATFKVFGDLTGDNALASTARRARRDATEEYSVQTRRLDALLDANGETFVAKIDVEGHESNVVVGAERYLSQNRGVVQIESFPEKLDALTVLMAEVGYHRMGWLHHDHLFTNVADRRLEASMVEVLFDEVQSALGELQDLRRMRRAAVRVAQSTLDTVRFPHDPVLQ